MKTKEELNTLKEEFESVNKKLNELTDDELSLVSGGVELPLQVRLEPTKPEQQVAEFIPTKPSASDELF